MTELDLEGFFLFSQIGGADNKKFNKESYYTSPNMGFPNDRVITIFS